MYLINLQIILNRALDSIKIFYKLYFYAVFDFAL